MLYTPDRAIVAQLRRIDKDLSVAWVDDAGAMKPPPGRWAVFHALQTPGNLDETADRIARDVQADAAKRGYILDLTECQYAAMHALRDAKLVCYVVHDDGSFQPLDGRIVQKLRRMDYLRQNNSIRDWQEMMNARARIARDQREKQQGEVWDCIRRDKVFARQMSDILWGLRPTRSVIVPDTVIGGAA